MTKNIGHFGSAVIGEEQYEKEQELLQQQGGPGSKFGPAVTEHPETVPDEEPEEETQTEATEEEPSPQAADELERDTLPEGWELEQKGPGYYELTDPEGEKVEGPSPSGYFKGKVAAQQRAWEVELDEESSEDDGEEPKQGSIAEVEETLAANPDAVDSVMTAEFQRADGPREEVLQAIHEAESSREDGPRDEVMNVLSNFGIESNDE